MGKIQCSEFCLSKSDKYFWLNLWIEESEHRKVEPSSDRPFLQEVQEGGSTVLSVSLVSVVNGGVNSTLYFFLAGTKRALLCLML